ncbi:adenylosuccinate lyase [Natronolimnobius sp. AArcel1]|uniref:adenylosuccinate lyase n=1 Tax=Natronolimnobius sp. AArcel1 TaxID=1679093 RepID=UPI0013EB0B79|nr:adenylosuccinate lyase [Natronolimnobius sp. AArcel1]NGM69881.1 adenylosuccinate lyase [Natronolimnobius sp. AArcel1]
MTETDALYAVSPLDGRYSGRTAPLSPYTSEAALMRARVRVEVEYLIALADLEATPLEIDLEEREHLRGLYKHFAEEDAQLVKKLETEGHAEFDATNHDVKAVEYFIRHNLGDESDASAWIHFGLTSEDVNNLAHRLLVRDAVSEVLLPELYELQDTLADMAREHRDLPMLARTHGQPATPTTFGKELAVYASRLGRATGRIKTAADDLRGKLGGASGTYAAHVAAYPDVDWQAFAESFITEGLSLEFEPLTTQVNPCDDLAAVFDAFRGANDVLLDLDLDMWLYVSDRYLGQEAVEGETGSSTMPHKVNPIDFENSEGNLSKANSDLTFLADYVTTSRLQRDLSDSTVKRNIGSAFAHCLIGYTKAATGLSKVVPNEHVMRDDLESTPVIIGEAVQTILRREGQEDAYEQVKALTRGKSVTLADFRELFDDLEVDESVREELRELTPTGYTGVADELVDDA